MSVSVNFLFPLIKVEMTFFKILFMSILKLELSPIRFTTIRKSAFKPQISNELCGFSRLRGTIIFQNSQRSGIITISNKNCFLIWIYIFPDQTCEGRNLW